MVKRLLLASVIMIGILAVVISVNNSYHPVRPFYFPPRNPGSLDKFGIKEIFLNRAARNGTSATTISNYPRIGGKGPPTSFIQQNNDGTWMAQSTEVHYGVLTPSGHPPDLIPTLN